MVSSNALTDKTLTQYRSQLADPAIRKAIDDRDAPAALRRAKELLAEAPAPSRSRLLLDASGGQPLSDDERQASRLRRFVDSLEMAESFTSTINTALLGVHTSAPRHP